MKFIDRVREVYGGKWGYGPFQSDHAADFAWELEYELLGKVDDMLSGATENDTSLDNAFVVLELLTHIKNNSLDKNKKLYRKIREKALKIMDEESGEHREPQVYVHERMKIIDALDQRILTDSGHHSYTEDPPQLTDEENKQALELEEKHQQEI